MDKHFSRENTAEFGHFLRDTLNTIKLLEDKHFGKDNLGNLGQLEKLKKFAQVFHLTFKFVSTPIK